MSRTASFRALVRAARISSLADHLGVDSREATERYVARAVPTSRRRFLQGSAAALTAASVPTRAKAAPTKRSDLEVAIVGAGMAGLACADALDIKGISNTVFEAAPRVGGRVYSYAGPEFLGQTAELGGELIDTLHTTMRGYANELGLTLEDYNKAPGEIAWYCDDRLVHEHEVVDEYRAFVAAMRADLQKISGPTADAFTPDDEVYDYLDLRTYMETRGAGRILTDAIDSAYTGEYGKELHDQSCLNFLLFIHADKRSKFAEFGQFSDERFHVVGGNGQIPAGLAARLNRPVETSATLVALARRADGAYVLTFDRDGSLFEHVADYVVLTLPFSALRHVELDPSLGFPDWKLDAIHNLDYGTNAKTMVSFTGRPWQALGSSGGAYARHPAVQNVWETSGTEADATRGMLTDYAGGDRGAALRPNRLDRQVESWLDGLEDVLPGVAEHARRVGGDVQAVIQHWPTVPTHRGSYTNNHPGYFTTIAGNEQKPVGNVLFAGEHCDSFYEWQGFMEGAANSGLAAADAITRAARQP